MAQASYARGHLWVFVLRRFEISREERYRLYHIVSLFHLVISLCLAGQILAAEMTLLIQRGKLTGAGYGAGI